MMDGLKALIFDYGGTLDTGGCHWACFIWHAYQERRLPISWQQFSQAYVYAERTLARQRIVTPEWSFRQTLNEKISLQLSWLVQSGESGMTEEEKRRVGLLLTDRLYQQVRQKTSESALTLRELHSRFPMVVVSNFYGNLNKVLREFALDSFFDDVVESATVGVRKPDPQIFTLGVEKLALPPQQVMVVGDSIDKDMVPASKLGCRTVWLRGEGWPGAQADTSMVDWIIDSLSDLSDQSDQSEKEQ